MSYSLHEWDPDDGETAGRLAALLRTVFRDEGLTTEWFLWKHARNPWGASVVTYAVDAETGGIAAMRALWRWPLACAEEQFMAFQPCDTATHPDHQRKGLFSALTAKAVGAARTAGALLLFNFPNANSMPGYLKLGWTVESRLPTLVRAIHPLRGAARLCRDLRGASRGFRPDARDRPGLPANRDSLHGHASLGAPASNAVCGIRTPQMLQWRAARHPLWCYRTAHTHSASVLYRTGTRLGMRETSLEDVAGCFGTVALREVVALVSERTGADTVSVALTERHPMLALFREAGFVRVAGRGRLAVRYLDRGTAVRLSQRPWALTGCDLDTH